MARSRCSVEEPGHCNHKKYSPHGGEEGGRVPVGTAIEVGRRWRWHHEEPEVVCCRSSFLHSLYQFLRGRT